MSPATKDRIECLMPKASTHAVKSPVRAHWRYYRTLGVVIADEGDNYRVLTYGSVPLAACRGLVLERVAPATSASYGPTWDEARVRRRLKARRKRMRKAAA